ncbi:MAG: hypothetical protein ABH837_02225 [bacterium]
MKKRVLNELQIISHKVRSCTFQSILNAGSGHLGGCSSSVELMVALYFGGILKFDPANPDHPLRDRVLVRGHLGPLRYSIFSLLGWISDQDLLTYRTLGSKLQGHESMELVPGVDITPSGSLGMVLSYGAGCAFALRKQNIDASVYVFLGDGEEQEGSISEAARHVSHLGLTNLVCVIDRNKKQLSRPTSTTDSSADLAMIWKGYGWSVLEIEDGHSIEEIIKVFTKPRSSSKPTLIITNTIKGYGLRGSESNSCGYHTLSSCPKKYVFDAIKEQTEQLVSLLQARSATISQIVESRVDQISRLPDMFSQQEIERFKVDISSKSINHFDDALVLYFKELIMMFEKKPDMRLYVMTADWNSEMVIQECCFNRDWIHYVDVGIREQHLLAMAHGISVTDQKSRILIIDADFLVYRFADQLQVIAQAQSKMVIVGTDSGICEGRNGSTHQSTGQPGMLVSMPGLLMLEPADAVDLHNCLNWAFSEYPGPIYLRLHSSSVPQFSVVTRNIRAYTAYEPVNPCKIVLAGSGLPLGNMVSLAERLDLTNNMGIRVVNIIDMEHLDCLFVELLQDGIPLLTIYNGNPLVLESAVARVVLEHSKPRPSIIRSHGFTVGTTGRLEQLFKYFRLDEDGIAQVIQREFSELVIIQ